MREVIVNISQTARQARTIIGTHRGSHATHLDYGDRFPVAPRHGQVGDLDPKGLVREVHLVHTYTCESMNYAY